MCGIRRLLELRSGEGFHSRKCRSVSHGRASGLENWEWMKSASRDRPGRGATGRRGKDNQREENQHAECLAEEEVSGQQHPN